MGWKDRIKKSEQPEENAPSWRDRVTKAEANTEVSPDVPAPAQERSLEEKITGGITASVPRVPVATDLAEMISAGVLTGVDKLAGMAAGYDDPRSISDIYQEKIGGYKAAEQKRKEDYPVTQFTDFAMSLATPGATGVQTALAGGEAVLEGGDASDVAGAMALTRFGGKGVEKLGKGMSKLVNPEDIARKGQEKAKNLLSPNLTEEVAGFKTKDLEGTAKRLYDSPITDKVKGKKDIAEELVEVQKGRVKNIEDIVKSETDTKKKLDIYNTLMAKRDELEVDASKALEKAVINETMSPAAKASYRKLNSLLVKLKLQEKMGDDTSKIREEISKYQKVFEDEMQQELSLEDLWKIRKKYDKAVPKNTGDKGFYDKAAVASAFRDVEDDLGSDAYKAAKAQWAADKPVEDLMIRSAVKSDRYGRTLPKGTLDKLGHVVSKTWDQYGSQLQMAGYKKAGKLFKNPKYARMVASWAERGPAAMRSSHLVAMERDPEYRKAYMEDKENTQDEQ